MSAEVASLLYQQPDLLLQRLHVCLPSRQLRRYSSLVCIGRRRTHAPYKYHNQQREPAKKKRVNCKIWFHRKPPRLS